MITRDHKNMNRYNVDRIILGGGGNYLRIVFRLHFDINRVSNDFEHTQKVDVLR